MRTTGNRTRSADRSGPVRPFSEPNAKRQTPNAKNPAPNNRAQGTHDPFLSVKDRPTRLYCPRPAGGGIVLASQCSVTFPFFTR